MPIVAWVLALIYFSATLAQNLPLIIAMAKHLRVRNFVSVPIDNSRAKELSQNFIFFQSYPKNLLTITRLDFYGSSVILLGEKTFSHVSCDKNPCHLSPHVNWLLEADGKLSAPDLPVFIPIDSDFWISEKQSANSFSLSTIYQLRSNYPQIRERYGNFSPENGLSGPLLLPSVTRRNFHNISFIVFVPIPNLCDFYSICAHYKMWSDFGMVLNFTQIDANPVELKTIYRGDFDGEGIHGPFHATLGAEKNLLAVTLRGSLFIFIKDRFAAHSNTWLAISKPFENAVWASLAGWLIISSLILAVLHYLQGYEQPLIIQSAFTPLDAICCQASSVKTEKVVSRWSLLMPRVLAAILYPAYAAAVISFLTVNIPSVPFNNIIGLHDDGTYQVGSLKADSFSTRYFNESPVAKLKEIGRRMQLPYHKLMDSYEENLQYLCSKKFAFLTYEDVLEPIAKPCKIIRIPTPVATGYGGLSLHQNSSFKKALNFVLLKMHSSGYISRIQHQIVKNRERDDANVNPIAMPQVVVPFLIFAAGLLLSLLILSIEMIFHQRPSQTNPAAPRRKHRGHASVDNMFVYVLLGFVRLCSADDLPSAALANHLSLHQIIFITRKIGDPHIPKTIKSMSEKFLLSQFFEPSLLKENLPDFSSQCLIQVSDSSIINQDLADDFPGHATWLVMGSSSSLPYIPVNSDIFLVHLVNPNFYNFESVYQLQRNASKVVKHYGIYSKFLGLSMSAPNWKPSVLRRNFQGMPWVISVPIPNVCYYKTGCWHYKLWLDFGQALNFTVVYANSKEVKEMYQGRYEGQAIVAPFHALNRQRHRKLPNDTILAPVLKGWVFMYVKDTFGTYGGNWLSYVRPFQIEVWICLGGWLLLVSIVIMIIHCFFGQRLSFIIDAGLTPLDAICCQGATIPTKRQKSRITAFMPQLVAAVIFPAYAAAIVSFLTVHIQMFPFDNVEGLIEDGTYRIGCLKIDFFLRTLIENNEKLSNLLVPEDELSDNYENNNQRLCRDRKYVFFTYNNLFVPSDACKSLQLPTPVTFLFTGIPVALDSPYLHALRFTLINMHSSGVISRAQKEVTLSPAAKTQTFDPIPIKQLAVPFMILLIGILSSLILLLCEVFYRPKPRRRNRIVVFTFERL